MEVTSNDNNFRGRALAGVSVTHLYPFNTNKLINPFQHLKYTKKFEKQQLAIIIWYPKTIHFFTWFIYIYSILLTSKPGPFRRADGSKRHEQSHNCQTQSRNCQTFRPAISALGDCKSVGRC